MPSGTAALGSEREYAPRWSERNAKMVGAEAGEFHEV